MVTEDEQSSAATTCPRFLVLTHHKCASSFVVLYLRELYEINGLRLFTSHLGSAQPPAKCDVCVLTNACYARLGHFLSAPALHIIRNPLDVVVSAYYSHYGTHSLDAWPELETQRRILQDASNNPI